MKEYTGKEVIVMACSTCNANCSHCYVSYKGNRTPEDLLSIVRNLKKRYSLNINGAEVLTNFDYLKSYKEIGQHFVLTNGIVFLKNGNVCNTLKENDISSISLSYHFGIQDNLSLVKIRDLDKIVDIIKSNNFEFRLMTTITSENYKLIPYMCKKAEELGARGIKFTNFMKQGNGKNLDNKNILSDSQINNFFKLLLEERDKYKIEELIIERCGTFGKNTLSSHDNFYCDCITDSIVLTPDNNIYPCVFLAQPGYEIGKFENGKIYIYENYENNHDRCIAKQICNEHKKILVKKGVG